MWVTRSDAALECIHLTHVLAVGGHIWVFHRSAYFVFQVGIRLGTHDRTCAFIRTTGSNRSERQLKEQGCQSLSLSEYAPRRLREEELCATVEAAIGAPELTSRFFTSPIPDR